MTELRAVPLDDALHLPPEAADNDLVLAVSEA